MKKKSLIIVAFVLCAAAIIFLGVRLNQDSSALQNTRAENTQLQEANKTLSASLEEESSAR